MCSTILPRRSTRARGVDIGNLPGRRAAQPHGPMRGREWLWRVKSTRAARPPAGPAPAAPTRRSSATAQPGSRVLRGLALLFVGRHYRLVALTDPRLLVFRRRGGGRRRDCSVARRPPRFAAGRPACGGAANPVPRTRDHRRRCDRRPRISTQPARARSRRRARRWRSRPPPPRPPKTDEWPSSSPSTPAPPGCGPSRSTITALAAPTRTASSPSTSRGPGGSSTIPTRSGPRCSATLERSRRRARRRHGRRPSASPTSARRSWCGIAAPADPATEPSCGRTGGLRSAATDLRDRRPRTAGA